MMSYGSKGVWRCKLTGKQFIVTDSLNLVEIYSLSF